MSTTPKWGLHYPQSSDVPDVPYWMQQLATDLDDVAKYSQGVLASRPAATTSGRIYLATDDKTGGPNGTLYVADGTSWRGMRGQLDVVTALPSSPSDGQECLFQSAAMATAGVMWHLRYRSGASGSYKWEFVGGPPISSEVTTNEATSSSTFVALATAGPSVALPLAGDYVVRVGAHMVNSTSTSTAILMSYDIGATTAVDADGANLNSPAVASMQATLSRSRLKTGLSAVTLTAKYRSSAASAVSFMNRWMEVIPVRVG